ncbi:AMP-binding protein [Sphingorhabdus contaminans]|uniref:AMP-binding protein n=1 Tax=Sphingorhabdus contaminans TaxID=1343899 RepID=UPI003D2C22D9
MQSTKLIDAGFVSCSNFAQLAAIRPNKSAIVSDSYFRNVSFKELEKRSNRIANFFRFCGLKTNDLVTLQLDRDPRLFETLLGAQKAGLKCQLLPTIDVPNSPDTSYMTTDSRMLISTENLCETNLGNFGDRWYFDSNTWLKGDLDCALAWVSDVTENDDTILELDQTNPTLSQPDIGANEALRHMGLQFLSQASSARILCLAPLHDAGIVKWCIAAMSIGAAIMLDVIDSSTTRPIADQLSRATHVIWGRQMAEFYRSSLNSTLSDCRLC